MYKKIFYQLLAFAFFVACVVGTLILISNREKSIPKTEGKASLEYKEAMFYENLGEGIIQCNLCPNRCILSNKQIGLCKARQNIDGKLYSIVYGNIAASHIDPIEKKPLYHFLPGTTAYSIATTGCNLSCKNCQNWDISQKFPWEVKSKKMTPQEIVDEVLASGSPTIAYTYSEPVVFYELMFKTAKLAHEKGLKNIMHSNGYINQEPLIMLLPYLDAANIDLKGFTEEFYQKLTNGHLNPVLETLKTIHQSGTWLEITYLIIPSYNDNEDEIRNMARWVKENLGEKVPIHFSRFFPLYKLANLIPTPLETIKRAREIALEEGLKYVYTGNVAWEEGNTTFCNDGRVAIRRQGYFIAENNLKDGTCPDGTQIDGVWE